MKAAATSSRMGESRISQDPGLTATSSLERDHIVAMDRTTRMEGLDKLTKSNRLPQGEENTGRSGIPDSGSA